MQKGIAPIYILVGMLIAFILIGGSYLLGKQSSSTTPPVGNQKACTLEAKLCPDGSSVGRSGPNCEFAQCPTDETSNEQAFSYGNWKTYTNGEFAFKYPNAWIINGYEIKGSSPTVRIVIAENSSLMNECMEEISTNKQGNLFTRRFHRVVTGAMCGGGDSKAREIWVVPEKDAYGPGIAIYYSAEDATIIETIIDQIISTFEFN